MEEIEKILNDTLSIGQEEYWFNNQIRYRDCIQGKSPAATALHQHFTTLLADVVKRSEEKDKRIAELEQTRFMLTRQVSILSEEVNNHTAYINILKGTSKAKITEIEKLIEENHTLTLANQQILEASKHWQPMFQDQARIIRELEEQLHQRDLAIKMGDEKSAKRIAELEQQITLLKSPEWMGNAADKIYLEALREPDEMNYQEQTFLMVEWMMEALTNQLNNTITPPAQ